LIFRQHILIASPRYIVKS